MIPGERVTWVCARLLRTETFGLMVSPAIADLQFEAPTAAKCQIVANYVALYRAFIGALLWDVILTLRQQQRNAVCAVSAPGGLPILPGVGLFAFYAAAVTLFVADIAAGAQRLSRSAVTLDPTLRSVATIALTVLAITAAVFVFVKMFRWLGRKRAVATGGFSLRNGDGR